MILLTISHHFSRLIVACFDVFGSDSVAVAFFLSFVDCSSQLFSRDLWDSRHLIGVVDMHIDAALIFILTDFLFRFFLFIVVVNLFVEFTKDIGDPHSGRDESSQALMSSARTPYRILQFFTRDRWHSRHFFSVANVHVSVALISMFALLIVVVKFFVEFTKDIGNPFT